MSHTLKSPITILYPTLPHLLRYVSNNDHLNGMGLYNKPTHLFNS